MKELEAKIEVFKQNEAELLELAKELTMEIVSWCQELNYYPVIQVDGRNYKVETFVANQGDADYFSVEIDEDEWRIVPAEQGSFGYRMHLFGDYHCPIRFMNRETWQMLVNDIPEIFERFELDLKAANQFIRERTSRLREMVEAGKARV